MRNIGGNLDELNNILSVTQKKINKFKVSIKIWPSNHSAESRECLRKDPNEVFEYIFSSAVGRTAQWRILKLSRLSRLCVTHCRFMLCRSFYRWMM